MAFRLFKTPLCAINLAIALSIPGFLCAQEREKRIIDSLLKVLSVRPDDTNKVELLCEISVIYYVLNASEGIKRGNEALTLAEKLGWKKGIAKAYKCIGSNYWWGNDYLKAQEYYLKSLKVNEEIGDKHAIANSLHSVGIGYSSQPGKSRAAIYFEKALKLYKELGDSSAVFGCYLNLGELCEYQNNISCAIRHYEQALEIAALTRQRRNFGYVLNTIGRLYASEKDTTKSYDYEERAIRVFESLGQNIELASQLGNAADVYFVLGDYQRSLNYYNKAIRIFNREIKEGPIVNMVNYGSWYGKTGKIQLLQYKNGNGRDRDLLRAVILNSKKALSLCENTPAWACTEEYNRVLSEAYEWQGNTTLALKHLKIADAYRDSLSNTAKQAEIRELELVYEYDKKKDSLDYLASLRDIQLQNEKKINRLALKEQWLYSILIIVVLCLISSYFVFRYHVKQLRLKNELDREKTEKQLKEAEYHRRLNELTFAALRSQMNPHFIFNALNTIQSFVYTNDKGKVSNYLGKFSELVRKILDNSNKDSIPLAEEIHVLQLYFDIEKARFGDKFFAEIETDATLDMESIFIPPMLIQPYAENAIKHGLFHLVGEKRLLVSISRPADGRYVDIIIDDNGIGREKSKEINKKRIGHHSFANEANDRRIDLINQIHHKKTRLDIIDKKHVDGSAAGTRVVISIPVESTAAV